MGIALLVALVTLFILEQPLWLELEWVTGFLSLFVFAFIAHVLYHGVRFNKREQFEVPIFPLRYDKLPDFGGGFDVPSPVDLFDFDDGCAWMVIGLGLSLAVVFGLTAVLWLGLNVASTTAGLIALPLFFIFRLSLRRIVAAGRTCRHRLGRSLWLGARMTVLYMVWFYLLIFAAHELHAWLRG